MTLDLISRRTFHSDGEAPDWNLGGREVPAALLHASDRHHDLAPGRDDDGVGHDPVLARADEESSELLDDSPILLDHLEHAGRHGLVTEQGRLPRRIRMEEREQVELAQAVRGSQLEAGNPGPHGRFEGAIGCEWLIQEISPLVAAVPVISGASGRGADRGRWRPRP